MRRFAMNRWGPGRFILWERPTPGVRWLLTATVAVYIIQIYVDRMALGPFAEVFALSMDRIQQGRLWQPVTYMFLHDPRWPWHLLVNMLVLFFLGPETERAVGTRQFLLIYFLAGVLGAAGWLVLGHRGICIGASGAVFGVLGAFAALFPHRYITVLLFFIFPITVQAWVLVAVLAGMELLFLMLGPGGRIAHSVHLAGGLAGYVYALTAFRHGAGTWLEAGGSRTPRFMHWFRRRPPADRNALELDRILEKIANEGMGSLTARERSFLEETSRRGRRSHR